MNRIYRMEKKRCGINTLILSILFILSVSLMSLIQPEIPANRGQYDSMRLNTSKKKFSRQGIDD